MWVDKFSKMKFQGIEVSTTDIDIILRSEVLRLLST